jgi:hypothetical protein
MRRNLFWRSGEQWPHAIDLVFPRPTFEAPWSVRPRQRTPPGDQAGRASCRRESRDDSGSTGAFCPRGDRDRRVQCGGHPLL